MATGLGELAPTVLVDFAILSFGGGAGLGLDGFLGLGRGVGFLGVGVSLDFRGGVGTTFLG